MSVSKPEMLKKDILNGKTLLKKESADGRTNLYDILTGMITQMLTDRPDNAMDFISGFVSSGTNTPKDVKTTDALRETKVQNMQIKLFKIAAQFEDPAAMEADAEVNMDVALPDCMHLCYIFEQAGIGIGREDFFRIMLSLKQFTRDFTVLGARFWGKIFGLDANYYIIEADTPLEEEEYVEDADPHGRESPEKIQNSGIMDGPEEVDDYPQSTWKPPLPVPTESHLTGANKKHYFVCNEIGEKWVQLPHVSPTDIVVARQISKLLTGHLDAPIICSPPFRGNEAHYLRAMIARISAATHICPSGFFSYGDDEDLDEDEFDNESFTINPEYDGMTLPELLSPDMSGWVHATQYILPQGRCNWFDVNKNDLNPDDEDFEDDFDTEKAGISETGPRILSSVADDVGFNLMAAWSTRLASKIIPSSSVVVAQSNNWPGAYSFAFNKSYENLYIGWGIKYNPDCYSPGRPGTTGDEYPYGPEVAEVDDPDVETEKAMKAKELAAMRGEDELDEMDSDREEDD